MRPCASSRGSGGGAAMTNTTDEQRMLRMVE